jgi:hypothetical protein
MTDVEKHKLDTYLSIVKNRLEKFGYPDNYVQEYLIRVKREYSLFHMGTLMGRKYHVS